MPKAKREDRIQEVLEIVDLSDKRKQFRDKARLLGSFAMPFMFLILFGSGMSGAMQSMLGGNSGGPLADFDFVEFMFPGIICRFK
ncbi:hypothetical protein [Lentibacillus amyloliquefaciens]|uniref:hypothetical protein n=1 Tax=Lentibacillus amyloliquefaciens TaxID=1472767 RepID=UPI002FF7F46A